MLTTSSKFLPLHLKQTFPLIIWIFTEGEGDGIENTVPFKISFTLALHTTCLKWFWLLLLCLKTQVRGHFCTALLCQMMPDRIIKCLIILFTRYYYQAVMLLFYFCATPSIVFFLRVWFKCNESTFCLWYLKCYAYLKCKSISSCLLQLW